MCLRRIDCSWLWSTRRSERTDASPGWGHVAGSHGRSQGSELHGEGTGLTKTDPAFFDGAPVPRGSSQRKSTVGQLELDAAVLGQRFVTVAGIDRTAVAEARGHQMLRLHAVGGELLQHRDGARRAQLPVRGELRRVDRALVGVAVNA